MKNGRRTGAAVAATISALLALSACGGSSAGGTKGASSPIKIGALLELTGPGNSYGIPAKNMIQMALQDVGGKINGHPVEMVYADTATDASTAVAKARQLIEKDHVDAIFGPVFSDAQTAIAPYLATKKVLDVAPLGGPWELNTFKNWVVFFGTLDSFCQPAGQWLSQSGAKTIATIGADYVGGRQLLGAVAKDFKAGGGHVVQQQWAPLGTSDFGSYISSLKQSDTLVAWTVMPDELSMIQTFLKFKSGSSNKLLLCEAENVTAAQLKGLGSSVLGTRGVVASYAPSIENAKNAAFIDEVKQRYNRTPSIADGSNYLAFESVLDGLKKTGGNASLAALRPAILSLTGDSIAGPLAFSKSGFQLANHYLSTVTNVNGTYEWKTDQVFEKVRDPRDSG